MVEGPGHVQYLPAQSAPKANIKTYGALAEQALFELRELAVGRPAPDIEGEDADGHRFKLSDYRGKVVVLTFSGNWCGPCRAMYPQERELVARLKDRPFALLSVNTDPGAGDLAEIDPRRRDHLALLVGWRPGRADQLTVEHPLVPDDLRHRRQAGISARSERAARISIRRWNGLIEEAMPKGGK